MQNNELQFIKDAAKKNGIEYTEKRNYGFLVYDEWEFKFNKDITFEKVTDRLREESVFFEVPAHKERIIEEKINNLLNDIEKHQEKNNFNDIHNNSRILNIVPDTYRYTGMMLYQHHKIIFNYDVNLEKLSFFPKDPEMRPFVSKNLDAFSDFVMDAIEEKEREINIKEQEPLRPVLSPRQENDYVIDFEL